MYRYTLSDAVASGAFKNVSGLCSDSVEFKELLNEATRRLWKRGNWFSQEVMVRFCIYNSCLALPRQVATLLGFRSCGGEHPIRNHWYDIVGPHCCEGLNRTIVETGTGPLYNEISGETGKYIRVYPTKLEDVGKTITLFGTDPDSQPLQEKVGGVWQRGVTLTLQAPYVQSSMLIKRIMSVTRQMTQADILVYEVDADGSNVRDLARYQPSETNPSYRKYRIPFCSVGSGGNCAEVNGVRLARVEALVSLDFIPLVSDNDFLAIDDFDSIKQALAAIRLEEANQDDAAEGKWVRAVRELNMTERKLLPGMQTAVRVQPTSYLQNPM